MKPDEIKAARTYIGQDGERRHVDRLYPSGAGFIVIFGGRGCALDVFASWAVRAAGEPENGPQIFRENIPKRASGGRGTHKRTGELNGWEAARARELDAEKAAGLIRRYIPHPFKIHLGGGAFYTPDFLVDRLGVLEVEEVKGHWEEAARVRIKVAAERFPMFRFVALSGRPGVWTREAIEAHETQQQGPR